MTDFLTDLPEPKLSKVKQSGLADEMKAGLHAPICLTWEWTYGCNLSCVHCLSSSGRRDPNELNTEQMKAVIDQLAEMQVFYINVGGGEPTIRSDFFELVEYAIDQGVGVKFSTNGGMITQEKAERIASMDYLDVQISLDGMDAETNDAVRGEGSYDMAIAAMDHLHSAGMKGFKISVVMTTNNVDQVDEYEALARKYDAELRLTRLRPSGRGAETWNELKLTQAQQIELYNWLLIRPHILTGDSFFHLSALGEPLPGLNLCGAGRVVCLIDPVGDVYACPFVLHDEFKAGSLLDDGGFAHIWRESDLFLSLREPGSEGACGSCGSWDACQGGCMAAKFFTGIPLDGPDPECVKGHGAELLEGDRTLPAAGPDHSKPNGASAVKLMSRPGGKRLA